MRASLMHGSQQDNLELASIAFVPNEGSGRSLSVPLLALSEVPRRHPEVLAEDAAEMREVVKAPGERNLADVAVGEHWRGEVAPALGEALGKDVALERNVLVGEEVVDIARRDAKRGCALRQRQIGI